MVHVLDPENSALLPEEPLPMNSDHRLFWQEQIPEPEQRRD